MATPDALYLGLFGPVGASALFYLTLEAEPLGANPQALGTASLVLVGNTIAYAVTGVYGSRLYRRATARPEPGG